MACNNLKDLCRLCAKKNDFSKNLLDEENKNILDLIKQYTQISIMEGDNFPTKVCLDCEEKLVSFQLFILECYKVQDSFNYMFAQEYGVKIEGTLCNFSGPGPEVPEIKEEFSISEEILGEINKDDDSVESGPEPSDDDFNIEDKIDEDEFDNLTIASIKQMKRTFKNKILCDEEAAEFQRIFEKPTLRARDFLIRNCVMCDEPFKTWTMGKIHYLKHHQMNPLIYCRCGFLIKSKSAVYRHVNEHKREGRVKRRNASTEKKVKDYIEFKCSVCEKLCSSWYTLSSHSKNIHKINPVVTCSCGILLKSKTGVYKHVSDHKNASDFSCDVCSLVTKSLEALNKHKLKHVPKQERKFNCSTCDKVFNNKHALRSHLKSHIPIEERKVFHCDICDLKFTTCSALTSHKKVVHHKIKSYVCDLCGYACGTNGELRQHRAIHSDEKPYVCKTCSKRFKTYSNLKTHMDIHGETSYPCYVCNRVLNSRRTLRKHLLVHEDSCRHECSYCNRRFKRRQTLKVHMCTHTGDKPLSCKWCDERFAYASTLRSHRLRCHPDKVVATQLDSYPAYNQIAVSMPEDYIKSDLAAISITKNEVETNVS